MKEIITISKDELEKIFGTEEEKLEEKLNQDEYERNYINEFNKRKEEYIKSLNIGSEFKIYFAHSMRDYDTEYELMCLNKIKELYPNAYIINPKEIVVNKEDKNPKTYEEFKKQLEKYFYPLIKNCNIIIGAATKNNKITAGVKKEFGFAMANNIYNEWLNIPYPETNQETINCYECGIQVINIEGGTTSFDTDQHEWLCADCGGL